MRVFLCVMLVGCASAPTVKRDAGLVLDCPVDSARVYIDETLVGWARDIRGRRLALTSGPHRVEIRAQDFFTSYLDVDLHGTVTRPVTLRAVPPGDPGD